MPVTLGCLCDLGQVTSLSSGSSFANYRSSDPHWVFVRIITKHKVIVASGPQQVYREGGLLWWYLQQELGAVLSVTVSDNSCYYCRVFGE